MATKLHAPKRKMLRRKSRYKKQHTIIDLFEEDTPQKAQALIDIVIKEKDNIERGIISKEVVAAAREVRFRIEKFQKEYLEQSKTEE